MEGFYQIEQIEWVQLMCFKSQEFALNLLPLTSNVYENN